MQCFGGICSQSIGFELDVLTVTYHSNGKFQAQLFEMTVFEAELSTVNVSSVLVSDCYNKLN